MKHKVQNLVNSAIANSMKRLYLDINHSAKNNKKKRDLEWEILKAKNDFIYFIYFSLIQSIFIKQIFQILMTKYFS